MIRFGDLQLDNVWPAIQDMLYPLPNVMEGASPLWLVAGPIVCWVLWQFTSVPERSTDSTRSQSGVVQGDGGSI